MVRFRLDPSGDGTLLDTPEWAALSANIEDYRERQVLPHYLKAPLMGLLEITGSCNLRCAYCYNDSPCRPPDMEWPVLERLVHELADSMVFSVCVSGGEPTLHPHYLDILRILREGRIAVGTITNGWTMTPELAREMARYAGAIQVSLDGPTAEIHDGIRGRAGSFDRAVRALRLLHDAGAKQLTVSFASTRLNIDSFPRMVDLCAGLGVSSLRTQPLAMVGRANAQADLEPTPEQTQRLDEFLKASGGRCGELKIEWGDPSVHLSVGMGLGLAVALRVTNDGNFGLTPYYPIFFGNAHQSSLAEVWESGLRTGWHHPVVRKLFTGRPRSPVLRLPAELEKPLHLRGREALSGGDVA